MKLDQQDARMDTPLLEDVLENQNSSQGASISGAVFNITTTMIGAGIMSIPAAIKVLGIVPGFLLILVVAFFTEITVEFLLRYTKSGKSTTYAGIVGESFGAIGSVAVQICVIITLFGALIIYLIIIGDVLCGSKSGETLHLGILQEWFGIHWWNSRAFAILFIVLFVMLPLVWQKRVVLFVVICSAMAIQALWEGKSTQKLRLLSDFSKVSAFDLFTTVPIFVTGFAFHVNVHPIRVELGKPTEMSLAVRISLAITVAIYSAIGFFGYLLFGDSIMSDMLVNFDQNSDTTIGKLLDVIVRLTYAIHLLLVFPLLNFTLRANIDELLFPKKPILASDTLRFVSLTCVLLAITYIIAIAIPDIWLFFQFMGSTTVVCLSFIFPGTIILRDVHGISTTRDKIIAILVILLAVGTSTIAISTSLYG
ncbi:hypothetical protein RGQ29_029340 [Quercus rubra]|uniref:Amino acid transporter transmembrane domain-containing protein n=1 Tax=Quercus rubra TaxID=3512 RepID=A0AAN7EUC0_QUERU|nr:hypothetical protein RGQ29_029340 [Quercus rubra]